MSKIDDLILVFKDLSRIDTSGDESAINDRIENSLKEYDVEWAKIGPLVQYFYNVLNDYTHKNEKSKFMAGVTTDEFKKAIKVLPALKRADGYEKMLPMESVIEHMEPLSKKNGVGSYEA